MMYEVDNDARQTELISPHNKEFTAVSNASLLDAWILSKMRVYDKRLDSHDKRIKQLEGLFLKDPGQEKDQGQPYDPGEKGAKRSVSPEKGQNLEGSLLRHYEKLSTYINSLRGRECIDDQFQHTTPVLLEIDKIFALYSEGSDRSRKQLILKLRSAVKLNRLDQLFTDAQVDLLIAIVDRLRLPEVGKSDVLDCLDKLMDCDLSPFPSLEEDQRENEAFSGHDDTDRSNIRLPEKKGGDPRCLPGE